MANTITLKRVTRAQIDTAAAASGLHAGEPYLITDEGRLAVGLTPSSYADVALLAEVGGGAVTLATAPPSDPSPGDLWWDSEGGQLFVRYDDGSSSQWVVTSPTREGPPGSAATLSVALVTTGAAGSEAQVVNTGTGTHADLAFTLPRGDKGDKGEDGTDGANGIDGTDGADGDPGIIVSATAPSSPAVGQLWLDIG